MSKPKRKSATAWMAFLGLSLGALGVVYGDIGTSPLYAINEIFFGHGHTSVTLENVYGAISLVVWTLSLVITVKYISFVLRADHQGEGGVFALLNTIRQSKVSHAFLVGILVLAAGLLFGEGIITPAISVLSAIEGLKVITPAFDAFIVPLTIFVLTILFAFQSKGTDVVGKVFGPIMLVWFFIIGVLGAIQIVEYPFILQAFNPYWALHFIFNIGTVHTMAVLGSVMLVITGGEALFADLAHFGKKPIQFSWLTLVYPALMLNYLGQGAFLLHSHIAQPMNIFFGLVPNFFLYPMVILATFAAIIASQALISGIFSLTSQAMKIGLFPRMRIKHTSAEHEGQIYIRAINWILYACCVELVLIFKTSTSLAASYGLSVSGVMLSTSLAMLIISSEVWGWSKLKSTLIFGSFILIDGSFLISNSLKFIEGGYVPLFIGLSLFALMNIWLWGRTLVWNAYIAYTDDRRIHWLLELKEKLTKAKGYLRDSKRSRVLVEADRVLVFMIADPIQSKDDRIPPALRIYMKRTGSMPKYIIFLNIDEAKKPHLADKQRFSIQDYGNNVFFVQASFGFMEKPDVRFLLKNLNPKILLGTDLEKSVIVIGKPEFLIDKHSSWLLKIRSAIFKATLVFAVRTRQYFGLNAEDGLSEVLIPIRIKKDGSQIKHPEFDLAKA